MTEVSRQVIVSNDDPEASHRVVECAIRADLASPAADFVNQMKGGEWVEDPYFTAPPDENQVHDIGKIVAELEHIADWGYPSRMSAVNNLDDGIWEIKIGLHRLAYFDTPGDGTYTPKPRVDDSNDLPASLQNEFWQYPFMDPVLRLTNGFSKEHQKAPPGQVALALDIRDEDVAHDA